MIIDINWIAVLAASVVGMVCAGFWYTNLLFGPAWRQLTGISEADSQKSGNTPMVIVVFANIITAIVLDVLISICNVYLDNDSIWTCLLNGFILWLAFSATTLVTHNAFEQKPAKLTWINTGYQLVLFLSMAFAIGLLRQY